MAELIGAAKRIVALTELKMAVPEDEAERANVLVADVLGQSYRRLRMIR
jgi:hypothetical protein